MDDILLFALVGFVAQLIDGSLGMAYGVTSSSLLLGFGVPPALTSASVHTAEVIVTAVSGIAHHRLGNIDRTFFSRLVVPGMIGGFLGVYLLTHISGDIISPFVAIYLLFMGIVILRKALSQPSGAALGLGALVPLGLIGGFFDAIGGGGWGPIVSSTLVASGHNPRFVIGSVNAAEFFVTLVQSVAFFILLRAVHTEAVIGLIIGGIPAAPVAAYLVRHIPPRRIMLLVGILIILLSLRTVYLTLST
jgi:hypothetical protein